MPSIHTLIRIATALGTEPGYFLEDLSLDQFGARKAG